MRSYFVRIVPPRGYRVVRLRFTHSHVLFALALTVVACAVVGGAYAWTIARAEAKVGALRSLTRAQNARLRTIDARAAQLDGEMRALQRRDDDIERLIGTPRPASPAAPRAARPTAAQHSGRQAAEGDDFATVAARIERLRAQSNRIDARSVRLQRLAFHIVDVRRLRELARVRVLAAIPSLNPAGDRVAIRSGFGWRADPWPEFHAGVDLDVDTGDNIRAAATGTVVVASDDGDGFGIKVDIDHGNGYHTWYAHLERADVAAGQRVTKGEHIGLVGSTGESTGPHLHYQVMLDGRAIDPTPYLDGVPAPVLASIR